MTTYNRICDWLVFEYQLLIHGTSLGGESDTVNTVYIWWGKNDGGGLVYTASYKGSQREKMQVAKDSCYCYKKTDYWVNKCLIKLQNNQRPDKEGGGYEEG